MDNKNKPSQDYHELVKDIDHVQLQKIKNTIGYGFVRQIKVFMKKKGEGDLTEGYIRRSLTLNEETRQDKILFYAVLLAAEKNPVKTEDLETAAAFLNKQKSKYIGK